MRLIDADALQALFNVVSTSLLGDAELCKDTEYMVRAFIMTTEMIQDAPTIDAVPVVRCKDCKYYKPDEYEFGCECDSGLVYVKANDDFCSYGEYQWNKKGIYPICPNCGAKMDGGEDE